MSDPKAFDYPTPATVSHPSILFYASPHLSTPQLLNHILLYYLSTLDDAGGGGLRLQGARATEASLPALGGRPRLRRR